MSLAHVVGFVTDAVVREVAPRASARRGSGAAAGPLPSAHASVWTTTAETDATTKPNVSAKRAGFTKSPSCSLRGAVRSAHGCTRSATRCTLGDPGEPRDVQGVSYRFTPLDTGVPPRHSLP